MIKLSLEKILPAVTIDHASKAVLVAEALLEGGVGQLEITFRGTATLESITSIRKKYPQILMGAGTIITIKQLHQAIDAGAEFGLSPGLNPKVIAEAQKLDFPFVPGVMTPTEIEAALNLDCKLMKLFPSGLIGGVAMIKALNGPYMHTGIEFIPMGGIDLLNMNDFLSISNVVAIGGSWLASESNVIQSAYSQITTNAKEAVAKVKTLNIDRS